MLQTRAGVHTMVLEDRDVVDSKWAAFDRRNGLRRPVRGQLVGALGALGGDDDPLLGKEILSQLRYGDPPASSIGGKINVLSCGLKCRNP